MICDDGENPLALWNGGHVSRAPRNLIQYHFEQNALGSFSQSSFQSKERLLRLCPSSAGLSCKAFMSANLKVLTRVDRVDFRILKDCLRIKDSR